MLKKFKNQILLLLFLFIIISFCSLILLNYYFDKKEKLNEIIIETNNIHLLLQKDVQLISHFYLYESKNDDFLETKKSKYLSQHHEIYSKIRNKIFNLKNIKNFAGMNFVDNELDEIDKKLKNYNDLFFRSVYLLAKRGNNNYGMEGNLNKIMLDIRIYSNSEFYNRLNNRHKLYLSGNINYNEIISFIENHKNEALHDTKNKIILQSYLEKYKNTAKDIYLIDKEIGITNDMGLKKQNIEISENIIKLINNFVYNIEVFKMQYFNKIKITVLIITIVIFISMITISMYMARKMSKRIHLLANIINDFVNSKFSKEYEFNINESEDEIGILIKNIKIMRIELLNLLYKFEEMVDNQTYQLILQKNIIEQKNEEIQTQLDEISEKKSLIEQQFEQLKIKNRYIIDSINYAKNIQEALLQSETTIKEIFYDSFILYLPKDIVSGDFYWIKKFNYKNTNYGLVAVGDCTGHGVPGAFMSMLAIAFLNEIVLRNAVISPDDILNTLKQYLLSCLHHNDNQKNMDDGMDIGICLINTDKNTLEFAGAKRSMYLIRKSELIILKGDNKSIKKYGTEGHIFSKKSITYDSNDLIYLFTDGITDQFGECINEKYTSKRLKNLLLEINELDFESQKNILLNSFQNWKGNKNQTDDMTMLGFKPFLNCHKSNIYSNHTHENFSYIIN
jgi:serine phosphatase RsbU (regulator of sigma subunit)